MAGACLALCWAGCAVGRRLGVVLGVVFVVFVVFCGGAVGSVVNRFLGPPISEVPAGEHVAVSGALNSVNAMTVDSGHLFVAEANEVEGGFRLDEFAVGGSRELVAQLATEPGRELDVVGVAVGHGTGEPLVYVAKSQVVAGEKKLVLAVYGLSGGLKAVWTGAGTPNGTFTCLTATRGLCSVLKGVAVDNSVQTEDWARNDVYVATLSQERPAEYNVVDVMQPEEGGRIANRSCYRRCCSLPNEPVPSAGHRTSDRLPNRRVWRSTR